MYLFTYYINIYVSIQESTLNNLLNGCQDQGFTVCAASPCQYVQSQLQIWTSKADKILMETVAQRHNDWYLISSPTIKLMVDFPSSVRVLFSNPHCFSCNWYIKSYSIWWVYSLTSKAQIHLKSDAIAVAKYLTNHYPNSSPFTGHLKKATDLYSSIFFA